MDLFKSEHNHASLINPNLQLLIGLRQPHSTPYSADGVFLCAQWIQELNHKQEQQEQDAELGNSNITTCVVIDGVRFTNPSALERLQKRIKFLTSIGWCFISASELRLVCFGMSHTRDCDVFFTPTYRGF